MAVQRVKNSKGEWVIVNGTGGVILDTGMSSTSPNGVQNKVIKKYIDDEIGDARSYSKEAADNAEKAAKQYVDDKVASGGGGSITEEKEVYIGSEEPPVGAKVWIDPQGTPSVGNGGSTGGGSARQLIFHFPILDGDELSESQKQNNAECFKIVTDALEGNMALPTILIANAELVLLEREGVTGAYGGLVVSGITYFAPNSPAAEMFEEPNGVLWLDTYHPKEVQYKVYSDGSSVANVIEYGND